MVLVTAGSSGAAQVSLAGVALAAAAGTCYGAYTAAAKALPNQGVPATAAVEGTPLCKANLTRAAAACRPLNDGLCAAARLMS